MSSYEDLELELVQVLFRHGDRTVDKCEVYPEDPDQSSYEFISDQFGTLTDDGEKRAFKLGETLRKRYGIFLGPYKPEKVHAYSTFLDRCQKTLKLAVTGLFPSSPNLTWSKNLEYTPIKYDCSSPEEEMFFKAFKSHEFEDFLKQMDEMPDVKEKKDEFDKILDLVFKKTGLPRQFTELRKLFQNLLIKKALGLPMPDWCTDETLNTLKDCTQVYFDVLWLKLKNLFVEEFMEKLIANIDDCTSKKNNKKIHMYSANDVTVYTFLRAHGIDHFGIIDYCGTVVLELLRDRDNKQYVRLLFWPGEGDQFETLKLKDCDEICPLEKYLEIASLLLPDESSC